jgi:hypothetical protein
MGALPNFLFIRVLGCVIKLTCQHSRVLDLLRQNYGPMEYHDSKAPDLEYSIQTSRRGPRFRIIREGRNPLLAAEDGDLLYVVEKDLTIELQKLRRDLYFLHAAALAFGQHAFLLVAPSGGGKSTTTWALLHHGFGYLSDELSPVDLNTMRIHSYPHAICLKREPPCAYPLPSNTVRTSRTLHIPVVGRTTGRTSLRCIFFLDLSAETKRPVMYELSSGEAAARLYAHALNPLAHGDEGLRGAVEIAQSVPSVYLRFGDLHLTCELIKERLQDLLTTTPSTSGMVNPSFSLS